MAAWAALVAPVVLVVAFWPAGGMVAAGAQEDSRRGGALYARFCVGCHGPQGQGSAGTGRPPAPAIDDVDVAYADLVIRTGRMPIIDPDAGVSRRPDLSDEDRRQLVAWMAEEFDLAGTVPEVREGDAAPGRRLFNDHCAACHSATGRGGVIGGGQTVRPIRGLDAVAIVEAARVGPFGMPSFGEDVLSDHELGDIAAALQEMDRERPSLLGIADVTHVTGAVYAVLTAMALVALVIGVARLPRIDVASEEIGPDRSEGDGPWEDPDRE